MVISQGEFWWADVPVATGYRLSVVVVQGDSSNQSRIRTTMCVPLTGNLRWEFAPILSGVDVVPGR